MSTNSPVKISKQDFERLSAMVQRFLYGKDSEAADRLDAELNRAEVVPAEDLPADVVAMNSKVVFEDAVTRVRREVILVFPWQANALAGRVSVMAPAGSAILGLAVGGTIDWPMPGGRSAKLRIVSVQQQPLPAQGPAAQPEEPRSA